MSELVHTAGALKFAKVQKHCAHFFCLQEKSLPGVVMALVCNVFEMLYQLANLDESR